MSSEAHLSDLLVLVAEGRYSGVKIADEIKLVEI